MDNSLSCLSSVMKLGDQIALQNFCQKARGHGDEPTNKRKQLINELKHKLGERKPTTSDESNKNTAVTGPTDYRIGNQNALKPKHAVRLGWIHNSRLVKIKIGGGGGSRKLLLDRGATKDTFMEEGKKLFFPGGESQNRVLKADCNFDVEDFLQNPMDSSVTLGSLYEKFKPSGLLRFYLHSKCQLSSDMEAGSSRPGQRKRLKKSKPKSKHTPKSYSQGEASNQSLPEEKAIKKPVEHHEAESKPSDAGKTRKAEEPRMFVKVNRQVHEEKPTLKIKYFHDMNSSYDTEITSTLSCWGRSQCMKNPKSVEWDLGDIDDTSFDPLENRYQVGEMKKGSTCFIQKVVDEQQIRYEFPAQPNEELILKHGPDEIWGWDEEHLILGIITSFHNEGTLSYQWNRDGTPICGANACIYVVKEPGTYSCTLKLLGQDETDALSEIIFESGCVDVKESHHGSRSEPACSPNMNTDGQDGTWTHSDTVATIQLHRGHVLQELLEHYKKHGINDTPKVEFIMPNRQREAAEDTGGVLRDVLTKFWEDFYEMCTLGEGIKVPAIRHNMAGGTGSLVPRF